jgi:hypothetical protein
MDRETLWHGPAMKTSRIVSRPWYLVSGALETRRTRLLVILSRPYCSAERSTHSCSKPVLLQIWLGLHHILLYYSIRCETRVLKVCTYLWMINSLWSRVFEKLIVAQLVKKLPAFCGTRKFITVFTRARLWSLFWVWCTLSPPHILFL